MFVINAPGAAIVTTSEAKRDIAGTFKVAEATRVYVTKDGQPIGGMVSMEMMALLEQSLAERDERMARRKNVSIRIVRRVSESQADNRHLRPDEGVELVGALSATAHDLRKAVRDAAP